MIFNWFQLAVLYICTFVHSLIHSTIIWTEDIAMNKWTKIPTFYFLILLGFLAPPQLWQNLVSLIHPLFFYAVLAGTLLVGVLPKYNKVVALILHQGQYKTPSMNA